MIKFTAENLKETGSELKGIKRLQQKIRQRATEAKMTLLNDVNPNNLKCTQLEQDIVQFSKKANPSPEYSRFAICTSTENRGGLCVVPEYYPQNYINGSEFAPHIKLDKLWATKRGEGTSMLQGVVMQSLENPRTQGRVLLDACCLDGKTAPGAFYYKLGFRHQVPLYNQDLEKWIQAGGKYEDAPFITGIMYLPKENIEHCLTYGCEGKELEYMQKLVQRYKNNGIL